jgi:hypothetical protein
MTTLIRADRTLGALERSYTMSAIIETAAIVRFATYERRRFARVELGNGLSALLGRIEGTVINLSARGACVRHSSALHRDGTVRLTIEIGAEQVAATARVISSRVVSLAHEASSAPMYESRLALVEVPHVSEYLLARFLSRKFENVSCAIVN